MDEHFAAVALSNSTFLCVGGVTRAETDAARDDGIEIDGRGYYLFLAEEGAPTAPVEILAKFVSESEAGRLARLLLRRPDASGL